MRIVDFDGDCSKPQLHHHLLFAPDPELMFDVLIWQIRSALNSYLPARRVRCVLLFKLLFGICTSSATAPGRQNLHRIQDAMHAKTDQPDSIPWQPVAGYVNDAPSPSSPAAKATTIEPMNCTLSFGTVLQNHSRVYITKDSADCGPVQDLVFFCLC